MNLLLIFIGGGLGAVARFSLAGAVTRHMGAGFPWGTLAVNLIGALLMGLIVELVALKWSLSEQMRLLLTTGFLGGFTTFSAFSLESALMVQRGDWVQLAFYVTASVIGTIVILLAATHIIRTTL